MKITGIRAIPLAVPLQVVGPPSSWAAGAGKQILVRATTDDGLTGWGECFAYGATEAVCHVIDDALAPIVLGQDPTQIEALVDRMLVASLTAEPIRFAGGTVGVPDRPGLGADPEPSLLSRYPYQAAEARPFYLT
jgi:L-alanine-DL-glutamate epimerase-like enolase superfamily enzyme